MGYTNGTWHAKLQKHQSKKKKTMLPGAFEHKKWPCILLYCHVQSSGPRARAPKQLVHKIVPTCARGCDFCESFCPRRKL